MAQSYRLCTWQKSKRLLLPWFPAVIVPRLSFTRTQTNTILDDTVYTIPRRTNYLYPCWVRVDLYTAGDEDFWVSLCFMRCTPRGVSILRIPLVIFLWMKTTVQFNSVLTTAAIDYASQKYTINKKGSVLCSCVVLCDHSGTSKRRFARIFVCPPIFE